MEQVETIKDLDAAGVPVSRIAARVGVSRPTVRKYLRRKDFSVPPPTALAGPPAGLMGPVADWVDEVLAGDRLVWPKQRHTTKRLHDRLRAELGFTGSYSVVQRYVKTWRERDRLAHTGGGFNDLVWDPGYAQVDFGEADFDRPWGRERLSFLQVVFPYSNQGFTQVFGGETAECVCQGLSDVFGAVGGVPRVVVFDNAAGVGRRVVGVVRETDLFRRFRLHHGFAARFCNPNAGHEKGCVENKVGTVRRNVFVPVPWVDDLVAFNESLLAGAVDGQAVHYERRVPVAELFAEDVKALSPLPDRPFDVVRWAWYTCDKYGKVTVDGVHVYSVAPEAAGQRVVVGFRAHTVDVLDGEGVRLATHPRGFGRAPTAHTDQVAMMSALARRPGAWEQSQLRHHLGQCAATRFLDGCDRRSRGGFLAVLHAQASSYGLGPACQALEFLAASGRAFTPADLAAVAARAGGFGLDRPPDPGPDLAGLDRLLGIADAPAVAS